LAQNYTRANRLLVLAAVATTLMIAAAAVWVSRLMYRRIQRLEDL
jgi:hypothetical protein